ncbi:MAG: hypothetical protein KJZ85_04115 [Rhodobacteraceae bacterium]|nr:hypothetical protein [Paracoccaceae bacterium]
MTRVVREGDGFTVEAEVLAAAFGIAAAEIPVLMRAGAITSRFETGTGEDAGRFRLTFFHGERVFRLVVDGDGRIVGRARFDAPGRASATAEAAGAAKNRFAPGGQ